MSAAALLAKLPDTIRVGPYDFALVRLAMNEAMAKPRLGEFSSRAHRIEIVADAPSKLDALDTLLHEINHAIFWAYQIYDEDKEERTVAMMATAWVQVYRDNPWLIGWIGEAVDRHPIMAEAA